MWESNPPFDPLRTESPALKAGEITGPLSPPSMHEHHTTKFDGGMQTSATPEACKSIQTQTTRDRSGGGFAM